MASFSVDITDIIFAGGRTGSKLVTISNAPSGGIGISNTGYGTHFRVVVKEENVSYSIETKATNSTENQYSSTIRFYNKGDSTDYVEISVLQYNVSTFDLFGDNLKNTSQSDIYIWNFGNQQGSTDLFIDSNLGYEGLAAVTQGTNWLSAVKENPTDTGFYHYTINYTSNTNAEERMGYIECTAGSNSGWIKKIIVNQAGGAPGASLNISPTSSSVGNLSGTVEITVSSSGISDVSYSISDSWIAYLSKRGSVYTFSYEANRTADAREGSITFSGGGISQTFTLSQESGNLSATPSSLLFTKEGGVKKTISVTYRGTIDFPAVLPSWINFSYYTGYPIEFDITPEENTSEYGRQYNLIFSDDISTLIVPIIQYGTTSPSLSVSPSSGRVTNESGSISVDTFANGIRDSDISVDISDSWLSFKSKHNYTFYFNYLANSSGSSRTATVTFSALGKSATYTLTQEGSSASSITVSPSSLSFGPDASYADISLTYGGTYYNTDAAEVHTWVTVNISGTETGKAAGTVSVASNTTTESRRGNVYFSDELGASIALPIEQTGISFALSANPSTLNIPASGGSVTTAVTYEGTLSAASLPSWLSETHTDDDATHRTYTVTAASNGPTQERTFNWRFDDDYNHCFVYISQVAAEVPSMVISPTSSSVGGSAGTVGITVRSTNISDISYSISDSWITYSSKSGSVYTFSYAENTTTSQRQGTITFSGGGISQTFTLIQKGISLNPISVDKEIVCIPNGGAGGVYVTITYSGDVTVSKPSWILSSTTSMTVDGKEKYSFSANARNEDGGQEPMRTGSLVFKGDNGTSCTVCICQGGYTYNKVPVIYPTSLNRFSADGESQYLVVDYNGTLTISDVPNWITINRDESDNGDYSPGLYVVTAMSNVSSERSGSFKLYPGMGSHKTVYVSQDAGTSASLSISPTSNSVGSSSGTVDITVTSSGISDVSYSISDSWITYSSMSGSVYTFSYAANNTASVRQGTITFSGGGISKTFTLSQEGQGGSNPLSVTPTELNFTASGGTKSVTVSGGTGTIAVNTGSFPSWLSIASVGNGVYNITASENSGVSRSFDVWFTDEASTTVIVNVSQDASSVKLTVSPSSKSFGSAGGSQVFRVTYNTRINYNTLPSWLSITSSTTTGSTIEYTMTAAENTDTSSRNFNWVLTDELTTVTVPISQSGTSGPGPGPEPVEEGSLKVYPKKLRYYSDGGRILVSFTNRPEAGIGYSITYTDGSGWLSVEGVTPNMYVSATANDGIRRRAEIKFYDLSDNTNYVVVPVIQGSVGGYNSIWMDDLYYPENRDTSGNYFYRVVNQNTGQTYFTGISSKPLSWTGNIGGIDIPRLVDDYIKSDFVQQNTGEDWADMHSGYCTVDIYNMTENGYPGVVNATFKYWNDWSRFERKYDYTRSLNDPINGKGCNNMIIPFCVYYDDQATFTIVDTKKNGNINTYKLSLPTSPFVMRYNSYYDIKKVEYKQDDDVLFSYDMNYCGPGAFIYRNRFGGWDSFLIEGNISKTDNYTKQNYRIKGEYNQEYSINTLKYIDEKRTDSIDIDTTYEASTGWLTDEESERLVFHLLSSPIVYFQNLHKENQLYDTDSDLDIIPVRITASSSEYKKFRNGRRLVNYLITFEKCNIEKVRQ